MDVVVGRNVDVAYPDIVGWNPPYASCEFVERASSSFRIREKAHIPTDRVSVSVSKT